MNTSSDSSTISDVVKDIGARGLRVAKTDGRKEVGHAYVYIMYNDLHSRPFALMEDVWIKEAYRDQGYGTDIVDYIIRFAQEFGCYKLICTSRHSKPKVHKMYENLGFKDHGKEFRMDF